MREMRRKEEKKKAIVPSSEALPGHFKPSEWTTSSHWCNKGYDFPFRGWEVRQPPGVRSLTSVFEAPRIMLFVFLSYSLPPSLYKEALTHCATGSIPTNWGQCRIELCSYGLIYMSISVDRRGNRIFALLIFLGFCVLLI